MIKVIAQVTTPSHISSIEKQTQPPMKLVQFSIMVFSAILFSCSSGEQNQAASAVEASPVDGGQATVKDDVSQQNVVQVAVGSADHTTLVAALKAASYVDALANAGPFTVFAPTDEAFSQLPAGTVEDLVKPENQAKLREILEYHVYIGVMRENMMREGQKLNQANMKNVMLGKNGDKFTVNGANILAAVPCSNGIIYVIDKVLLPE